MITLDDARAGRLRRAHLLVGLLHLAQAVVLLLLTTDFAIPLTATFASGPPGSDLAGPSQVVEVLIGPLCAAFLALAAVDHLLVAGPLGAWYVERVRRGTNPARWVEYSVSATLMILLIAALTGLTNVTALIAIAGANVSMIAFGHLMETRNPPDRERTDWSPFLLGCVAGTAPWLAIGFQLIGSEVDAAPGSEGVPTFVYGIFVSLFVFFSCFAVNQWLHYRGTGRLRDYVTSEYGYLVLSVVAKSLLAWQVFANVLIEP